MTVMLVLTALRPGTPPAAGASRNVAVGAAVRFDSRLKERVSAPGGAAFGSGLFRLDCARCATAASSSTPRPHRIGESPGLHQNCAAGTALLGGALPPLRSKQPLRCCVITSSAKRKGKWVIPPIPSESSLHARRAGSGRCAESDPERRRILASPTRTFPKATDQRTAMGP